MSELFAGLTEVEANRELANWWNERQDTAEPYLQPTNSGYIPLIKGAEELECWGRFTESHDSIHRVLGAMNGQEILLFGALLLYLVTGSKGDREMWLFAAKLGDLGIENTSDLARLATATPAQKALAALLALNLGRAGK